jgi:hypothetical protein
LKILWGLVGQLRWKFTDLPPGPGQCLCLFDNYPGPLVFVVQQFVYFGKKPSTLSALLLVGRNWPKLPTKGGELSRETHSFQAEARKTAAGKAD